MTTTTTDGANQQSPKGGVALAIGVLLIVAFGILLPAITLAVEAIFHLCGGVFFDPIPTAAHYIFVGVVPAINCVLLLAVCSKQISHPRWLAVVGGISLGITFLYALAFAPLIPMAVAGVLLGGLGLLPLSPLFAFICTYCLVVALNRKVSNVKTFFPSRYALVGLTAAFALLISTEMPAVLTRIAMTQAVSEDGTTSRGGIRMLRTFGNDGWLLNECYDHQKTLSDIILGALNAYDWSTKQKARRLYYRVTGRPFNSVPRPERFGLGFNFDRIANWDDELGSDQVGGKVSKLSLAESSLSGIVEPQGGVGYMEWTLNFKNDSEAQQEARTQIALPRGAVVSRVTLWINGKPQEAVFGSRETTRSAYQSVVHQSRDPVLVTTLGPDRVLLQCFPVPPKGGRMQARIGITTPLSIDDAQHARLPLPRLLENNFLIQGGKHNVFIQSPTACTTTVDTLKVDRPPGKLFQAHGFIDAGSYEKSAAAIVSERSPDVVQAEARFALKGQTPFLYKETLMSIPDRKPQHVIFIVDCGRSMQKSMEQIAQALKALPKTVSAEVRVASDEISALTASSIDGAEHNLDFAAAELPRVPCRGGPDNFRELLAASTPVKSHQPVTIVWIHGPQPVLPDDAWQLSSKLSALGTDHLNNHLKIYDVEAETGPNRVLELLDTDLKGVVSVPRRGTLKDDLVALFAKWDGKATDLSFVRTRVSADKAQVSGQQDIYEAATKTSESGKSWLDSPLPSGANSIKDGKTSTSPYLAYLWAAEETNRLVNLGKKIDATKLATNFRLVTPVSGAVVLETKAQYEAAGLDPDNPDANAMVPTAPEPAEWVLLFMAAGAILWTVRRKQAKVRSITR